MDTSQQDLSFLIAGLGSMGKRRIRCLKALGFERVCGFDARTDRRKESEERCGIKTYPDFGSATKDFMPDALVISTPPDAHHIYIKEAMKNNLHFFVEASVVDTDMGRIIKALEGKKTVAAPSATLLFHPAIQKVSELVAKGRLGKLSNIILHSGQYLPDWHTYEKVSDYYVSSPATGGCREIVPFELTWLTKVFGFPKGVSANFRKTINIEGAEGIDDTYNMLFDYGDHLALLTVDVVSRHAARRLLINGEKAQLLWDWDVNSVRLYNPDEQRWEEYGYEMKGAQEGYNPNIGENMYIDEIRNFVEAIRGQRPFVNTMECDHKILKLLYAIEKSGRTSRQVRFTE